MGCFSLGRMVESWLTMDIFPIIMLLTFCAIVSIVFYKIWLREHTLSDDDVFKPKYEHCVTKGDMYCSHHDWCDAEIALYPEQYEAEMKRVTNEIKGDGKK